jgi:fimbrial chaperone protein
VRAPGLLTRVAGRAARHLHLCIAAATASASLSCSLAVQAQVIAPVLLQVPATGRLATVSVTNTSAQAVRFQTEALAWTQRDGADLHEPTRDLLVVPPIAEVAPGATQVFRIAPRHRAPSGERAYRLVIEDITAQGDDPDGLAVALRVRHSLPVFVAGAGGAAGAPGAVGAGGPGALIGATAQNVVIGPCHARAAPGCVRVSNGGERHVSVASLHLDGAGWQTLLRPGAARVLAGAWMEWAIDVPDGAALPATVRAATSAGMLSATLVTHDGIARTATAGEVAAATAPDAGTPGPLGAAAVGPGASPLRN